jgi:hypothetical protein
MGDRRVFMRKTKEYRPHGKPGRRSDDNIEMDVRSMIAWW